MERKSKIGLLITMVCIVGLIGGLIVLNSCSLFDGADRISGPTGSLVLTVTEPMSPLIVLPDQNNTVAHYLVQIQHATSGANPIVQDIPAPPPVEGITFPNLPSGLYNIQILGLCSPEEEVITDAFDTALIAVNDETTVVLQMEIVDGFGDIDIDLTITPYDLIPFDTIVGEFYKDDVWSEQVWDQASQGVWGFDRTEAPGYYLHRWQLWSMGAEPVGPVSGACEAIYVRNNRTSAGLYALDENSIMMPDEGAMLVIIWEILQPIQTWFVDDVSVVWLDEPFLLETASDADPLDLHSWYKNGQLLIGEDTEDLAQTAPGEPGFANYSKVGQKGGICTSAQKLVVFMEQPEDVISDIQILTPMPVFMGTDYLSTGQVDFVVVNQFDEPISEPATVSFSWGEVSSGDIIPGCTLSPSVQTVDGAGTLMVEVTQDVGLPFSSASAEVLITCSGVTVTANFFLTDD